jgi:hypothetical protein
MLCQQSNGSRRKIFFLADLRGGIQDASIEDAPPMKTTRETPLHARLTSFGGAALVAFIALACIVIAACTINPQPLPPTEPEPTPTDPGTGGTPTDGTGGGGDKGSTGTAANSPSATDGGDADGGDGGDAGDGS